MVKVFFVFPDLLHNPAKGGAERFVEHRSAGFADGLQPTESPFVRTVLPQLAHEQAVRQHHQVHVPGLALAIAGLTVTHAPRKTRSRLAVKLCRRGLSPAKAPLKGFSLNFS